MVSMLVGGYVAWWKAALLASLYVLMVGACVWVTAAEVRIPTISYSAGVVKVSSEPSVLFVTWYASFFLAVCASSTVELMIVSFQIIVIFGAFVVIDQSFQLCSVKLEFNLPKNLCCLRLHINPIFHFHWLKGVSR